MLSRRLHANPDKVCYRKRYALSNTCLFVSRQTYVKDMSARPLVVGAAPLPKTLADEPPIANTLPLPKREGFLGFKMGKNREGL